MRAHHQAEPKCAPDCSDCSQLNVSPCPVRHETDASRRVVRPVQHPAHPGPFAAAVGMIGCAQGRFDAANASFTTTNPLGDPTLGTVASLDIYDLVHMAWITGESL